MKMSTNIPSITFLQAHAILLTRLNSDVGRLLGKNTFTQFGTRGTEFDVRGEFTSGLMSVTVKQLPSRSGAERTASLLERKPQRPRRAPRHLE